MLKGDVSELKKARKHLGSGTLPTALYSAYASISTSEFTIDSLQIVASYNLRFPGKY